MFEDDSMHNEIQMIGMYLPGWQKAHWENTVLGTQKWWARHITGDNDAYEVAKMYSRHQRGESLLIVPGDDLPEDES